MRTLLVVLFLVVLICPLALAAADDELITYGNDFLEKCVVFTDLPIAEVRTTDQIMRYNYCAGYVEGFRLMLLMYERKTSVCMPTDVTTVQTARVIAKYIRDNPAHAHELTITLGRDAMRAAFPCKK